ASTSSITKMLSDTTMQVALASVNSGLNSKPSAVKNRTEASRSLTGRLTKIWRDMGTPQGGFGVGISRGRRLRVATALHRRRTPVVAIDIRDFSGGRQARRLGPSRPEETAMRPVLPLLLVVALAACAPTQPPGDTPPPPPPATANDAAAAPALDAAALATSHWRLTAATDAAGQRIDALLPD